MGFDPRALTKAKADREYMLKVNNDHTIPAVDASTDFFMHYNLQNDPTSDDALWPDRWLFQFNGKHVAWFNEFCELRVAPAKRSTIPFRLFTKIFDEDEDHNDGVSMMEIVYTRETRTNIWRITSDGDIEGIGDTQMDGSATFGGPIRRVVPGGPTLETGYLVLSGSDPVPAGTPAGTLIVRT